MPRHRLVSRLLGAGEARVVVVNAPAGFGKSTLLAEWERADRRPFASLALGEHHDDPVALTASIARALARHRRVDEGVFAALYGAADATIRVAIPRLLESLRGPGRPFVLALDDVHLVRDPASLAAVETLANELPDGSALALASRAAPPVRLARLRASGGLVEMRAVDLAMTGGEAERLLLGCGLRLRPESVSVLVRRTEGWPAALYLAALSLRGARDPDLAAAEFAGDDRLVADYLRDEFVSSLGTDELDFLTRTSILDELSGELCDAVLGGEGSAATLTELARSNALLRPLDGRDRSFRSHALLREMLESELRRLGRRRKAELHARASSWYAEHDDFDRAVPHSIEAGDLAAAGELIWSQAARYTSTGREATLARWLGRFTEAQVAATPTLCLTRATCRLAQGDGAEVEHWTAVALRLLEGGPGREREQLRVAAAAIRAAGAAREGAARMGADAVAAFGLLPDDSPWRAICRLVEGVAGHLTGERGRGRAALEDGARRGVVAAPHVSTVCLAQLALIALDEGDVEEASRLASDSLARANRFGLDDYPTSALLFAISALVRARAGSTAAAEADCRRAERLLARLNELSPWYEAEARLALARALVLLDQVPNARAQLAAAGRRLRQVPDAPVLGEWLELARREADGAATGDRWPLTPAELRLLHYLPTHLSFREIADQLVVSPNTVKTQARSIYGKLGVSSRTEAVACARTAGLIAGPAGR